MYPFKNVFEHQDFLPIIGYCNICHSPIFRWGLCGDNEGTKYRIVGNGRRIGYCVHCDSVDRYRWFYFVIKNFTTIFEGKGGRILHFAPEKIIAECIKKINGIDYYSADIVEGEADYQVDMTDMPFEDDSFDYIIANHVLEHIEDERNAILECKRCIKKSGKIILSFPITMETETFSMDGLDDKERTYFYGHADHVRLYGKDYKERLENYGLTVEIYSPKDFLTKEMIHKLQLIEDDIILFCSKN